MEKKQCNHTYAEGLKGGIPIGLGYLSVAFTFGMMAVSMGLPVWAAVLISMTNLTSAGQFAGLPLIVTGASYYEIALTQLIINLRYALMSFSLSQKLSPSLNRGQRSLIAFGNTDEIFAVASGQNGPVGLGYMLGLLTVPYIGWAGGTFLGAAASGILPAAIRSALGIAIYGMFLAIIIPPAKHSPAVRTIISLSVGISCLFHFSPMLGAISSGFAIIICTLSASLLGAKFFPLKEAKR